MNLSTGKVLLEVFDPRPAVDKRLKFGRRTKVFEKTAALVAAPQADDDLEQGVLGVVLLPRGLVAVRFHDGPMY